MDELVNWSVRSAVPGGLPVVILVSLAMLGAVALGVRELRHVDGRRRRSMLVLLRLLTAAAILALGLQPQWLGQRVQRVDGPVVVLVDTSRSMSVLMGDTSRASAAHGLLTRWMDDGRLMPVLYTFGAGARPVQWQQLREALPAREDDTRIQRALAKVVEEQGDELGAVVLLSDGADKTPAWSAAGLSRLGVRVHTVALGGDEVIRDDAIVELKADPVAFLRQDAEVQVFVRAMPAREGSITVTLRRDSEVIKQIDLELSEDGTANTILPFMPGRLGRSVYTVSIPLASDDAVVENNERAFLVRVTRDKLRVLLVCGAPSWDSRFLRAFLKSDPSIDLITFFILRTSTDITMAPPEELSLIPFPTEELFREHLDSFDLVIFQDFDYGPYQMQRYLPRIRDYVKAGGAFAMIGGSRAFGAGGYNHTPIAQILPVTMAAGGELIEGEFRPVVAAGMVQHPVIGLLPGEADNLSAWGDLAPLIGANRLQGVRDQATALLRHPTIMAPDGQGTVVLAVGSSGDGRTLALGSDTSWRWGIATAGQQGDASAYERFWDRALRWLTRDPVLEPSRVETDRERYGPEGDLGVQALVRDDSYQPRAGLEVRLEVLDEAGGVLSGETLRLDEEGRVAWAAQAPVDPGAYRVALRAKADDRVLAEEGFVVEAGGDELADARPRPSLLREVSRVTQGAFFASPEDAPGLAELDRSRTRALGTVIRAPFASPWFFLVVALLLATEWSARRAWGLR